MDLDLAESTLIPTPVWRMSILLLVVVRSWGRLKRVSARGKKKENVILPTASGNVNAIGRVNTVVAS
jgi:hypothetical protein